MHRDNNQGIEARMIYLELFWSFFQIGLFSIGGGYAAMPLIEQQTVGLHSWLSADGFADIVTIAEMTPGPIALNAATFVGTQVAGFPGALTATIGCVLPSTCIVFLMVYLYYRYRNIDVVRNALAGVRPVVIALIASAGVTLVCMAVYSTREISDVWMHPDYTAIVVLVGSLLILRKWRVKPVYIILGSGVIFGIIQLLISQAV